MFLCYAEPAKMNYVGWENEALPLGNGKIGAKIFGNPDIELISFNEKTLWSGKNKFEEGFNYGISNPDEGKALKEIQSLLGKGDMKSAAKAMSSLEGNHDGFGAFQAFGSLYLSFTNKGPVEKYVRDLDLDTASSMIAYKKPSSQEKNKAVTYTRHYFVSHPDNVFVGRIESDGDSFGFDAYFVSEQKAETTANGNCIKVFGTVNANNGINAEPGKDKNDMKHAGEFRFILKDGEISTEGDHVIVSNCTSVTIIGTLATDYINSFPFFSDGSDPGEKCKTTLDKADKLSFAELYKRHREDYRKLYNRVTFTLGQEEADVATDFMLKRFAKRSEYKRNLISLLFQYGRYLLISSSREDNLLPANLQGIWNASNNPPWQCDYHFNINTQMNYWPAFVANLAETAEPYISFVNSLREPGRIVARKTMGADGWTCHTMINPFGMVAPGYNWRWGWSPANGAWAAASLMEHYNYTGDIEKLYKEIYPCMEEAALLWSQVLIKGNKDRLVVSPCFSPEHGPVSAGGTYEQSIIHALYKNVIRASEILCNNGKDDVVNHTLIETIKEQYEKLKPFEMNSNGRLKEWENEDNFSKKGKREGVEQKHRHLSHLLGLYPFDTITRETYIERRAATYSLVDRGTKGPAWAMTWRLLCYARLDAGEKCDAIVESMLKKSFLNNLFSNHPPFQIDGNFGFTAGICEMLLQSHEGYIKLLPALPKSWHTGKITGIRARGGYELSIEWKDKKMTSGTIKADRDSTVKLHYDGKIIIVTDEDGNEAEVDFDEKGISTVSLTGGKTYTLS